MIRKVLVALDASERAQGVFDASLEIARGFNAKLRLLRAITIPQEFPAAAHVSSHDLLPDHIRQQAMDGLLGYLQRVTGLSYDPPIVRVGQAWRTILEVAEEFDVDLVVLGSHGYDGLDRILGTTAGKVANLSRRNVMIVHNRVVTSSSSP